MILHNPDDGSLKLKHYGVDCFSINLSFYLDYLVIKFSLYCWIIFHYLLPYIYIYIYKVKLVTVVEGDSKAPFSSVGEGTILFP